jgi:hypothetical protein
LNARVAARAMAARGWLDWRWDSGGQEYEHEHEHEHEHEYE